MLLDHCQSIWGGGHFLKDMEAIDHTVYPPAKGGEGGPTQGLKMAQATSSFQGLSPPWTPPPPLCTPSHIHLMWIFSVQHYRYRPAYALDWKYLDEKTRNLCPPICNLVSYRFFFLQIIFNQKSTQVRILRILIERRRNIFQFQRSFSL